MTPTELYRSRKAAGLCPVCGGEREDKKRSLCDKCRAYYRSYYGSMREKQTPEERQRFNDAKAVSSRNLVRRRRQQGLCVQCGAVSPVHWLCETCYTNRKEKERVAFEADMLREAMKEEQW